MQIIQRVHLALPRGARKMALFLVGALNLDAHREQEPKIEQFIGNVGSTGHPSSRGLMEIPKGFYEGWGYLKVVAK
jgi:hypothetical protein